MGQPTLTTEYTCKHFYARFKPHQHAFTTAIHGTITPQQRQEYAWLMLNRILFLYFLQQKSLLDRNKSYLYDRLQQMQAHQENAFYRCFLLPLFHSMLARPHVEPELTLHFGSIPALHLSLFAQHTLEQNPFAIMINDEAFTCLFAFLHEYQWRLDNSTPQTEYDLSPAVLGYIFEQQINQKQMGTYYTSDDITHYIARNTIIPSFLHTLINTDPHHSALELLQHCLHTAPDRYIHAALRTPAYLHLETDYEYQQRRTHYQQLRAYLQTSTITDINELITHNLALEQLALDMIAACTQPDLLLHCYSTLENITILDPTCGTGAFLIAALHILQPLYLACLTRLPTSSLILSNPNAELEHHILTTILRNNLHGIDIMPGAIALCHQLLLLALLAYCDENTLNTHPLPDLSTTIRLGDILSDHPHPHFDIIIGNPPYIEYSNMPHNDNINGYRNNRHGNIYATIIERSLSLLRADCGFLCLLVPISLCTSARFAPLRAHITQQTAHQWLANFEIFPCRLFAGAYQRLTLLLAHHRSTSATTTSTPNTMHVTRLQRWYTAERTHLIATMYYTQASRRVLPDLFPKLASPIHQHIVEQVQATAQHIYLAHALSTTPANATDATIYYQEATNYWIKATRRVPLHRKNGILIPPMHGRYLYCANLEAAEYLVALLNSSLFYLWFATYSDGFHLAHSLVTQFPTGNGLYQLPQLPQLAQQLEADIQQHAQLAPRNTKYGDIIEIEEYHMVHSKPIIDEIDRVLAKHYGFTDEELDFILNYDIKYRMGRDSSEE